MREGAHSRVVAAPPGLCPETPKCHYCKLCTKPIRDRLPLVYLKSFFQAHIQIVGVRTRRISGFNHLMYLSFLYCHNYHHHHDYHFSLSNIIHPPLHFAKIGPSISSSFIPSNTHTDTELVDPCSALKRDLFIHCYTKALWLLAPSQGKALCLDGHLTDTQLIHGRIRL